MGQGNTFEERTASPYDAASGYPTAFASSLGLSAENNVLLNRLDPPLTGGSFQQAFIRACCAQQINA